MKIHIVNGPNLNMLERRPRQQYGGVNFSGFLQKLRGDFPAHHIGYFQSNFEGAIIDELQRVMDSVEALIINPAAYTHTSLALADCLEYIEIPKVEVHLSDISLRDKMRQMSLIRPHCDHYIEGEGLEGYRIAIEWLLRNSPGR